MRREIKFRTRYTNVGFITEQFTGAKDRKGTEVYEGDIIAGVNGSINGFGLKFSMEIKWIDNLYRFNIPSFGTDRDSTHWWEVVGNTIDNPELIENINEKYKQEK